MKRKLALRDPHGKVDAPLTPLPAGFAMSDAQPRLDSAATSHIVYSKEFLNDYVPLNPPFGMQWGAAEWFVKAIGRGTLITRNYLLDGPMCEVTFPGTLHVPELKINLIVVILFTSPKSGCSIVYKKGARCLTPLTCFVAANLT